MTHILFVCTGNTCRSPMAEAILKSKNIPRVEVKSAGVYAFDGNDASVNTRRALEEQGLALNHRAALLNESLVNWTTFILTMTRSHKEAVISMFPSAAVKTFTLKEFAGKSGNCDIIDPFGGSIEIYRNTFKDLNETISDIMNRLQSEKHN
ncbi:low molecular weight protein arginine phosphatase [Bacillus sp. FJAT-49705]|uniref:Low molecular weight protein arginine phosphatase n=1 Tax=Cytobacillus citreus TaxID=2833586 RepID=A0ABS5NQI8_9BACI|nr:low molecular weight protein arginine phosphatase [Cytobacillus citreus]MBS4190080.1 low molecular weight protein arginine phosphatase [Cytobacillus citreus]